LSKIRQELNGLGMEDVWRKREDYNNNVWREASTKCVHI
jgi:hypothetical protein